MIISSGFDQPLLEDVVLTYLSERILTADAALT